MFKVKSKTIKASPRFGWLSEEIQKEFSMNDKVNINFNYYKDQNVAQGGNFQINTDSPVPLDKSENYKLGKETMEALNKYVKEKNVLVVGSTNGAVIARACLHAKANSVTILEYNPIVVPDKVKKIKSITYEDIDNIEKFEVACSFSTYEHSGLGRYGDTIDPNGDIKSMSILKTMLIDDGYLILMVPLGKGGKPAPDDFKGEDEILWNAHRAYGEIRWPMLIEGWEIVFWYEQKGNWNQYIWVLRNNNDKNN